MKKVCVLSLMVGLVLTPVFVKAEEQKPARLPAIVGDPAPGPEEVANKICPVSHEEVGKDGMAPHKITYNGKVYNLCCGMCEKDFNKDPEKYVKAIEEEMKAAAPVSVGSTN